MHQKVQKNARVGCFDDTAICTTGAHNFDFFLAISFIIFFFDFWQRQISGKKNSPLIVGPWVSKDAKNTKFLMF